MLLITCKKDIEVTHVMNYILGQSNMDGSPEIEADILKNDFEVTINCIGIGDGVDRGELNRIASEPVGKEKHVYFLEEHSLSSLTALVTKTEAGS